ncbi:conserved hypothetical protein [Cellvibrio japonicus Ueda107]|uniref:DUF2066 domain-containing protein n=2 Tax=Cellvibrio japonicus TaxID=155077 RepID=B3PEQ7_CELJU|nr:conserved hypothetical protein [Cellvibrio japonicus Ueda107]
MILDLLFMSLVSLFLRLFTRFLCLFSVFMLWSNPSLAGKTLDIYKASTLVKNQSEAERNRAARATLGEVIVRVSGQTSALGHPLVQSAIPNAQHYLFGFSYHSTDARIQEGEKSLKAIALQLNYSPEGIEKLLRDAQLPLWPAQRPQVLVWPVVKDAAGTRFELAPEVLAALKARADYRGLPLVFPHNDIEDQLVLSADDAWAFKYTALQLASLRYKADAVLVLRYTPTSIGGVPPTNFDAVLEREPSGANPPKASVEQESLFLTAEEPAATADIPAPQGPWVGDWQLLQGDDHSAYRGEFTLLPDLFNRVADDMADAFANQYAIMPSDHGPRELVLRIEGVNHFGAFKEAQAYLAGLAMVKQMEVLRVTAEGLLVGLEIEGDTRLLVSTLALAKRMRPQDPASLIAWLNGQAATESSTPVSAEDEAELAAQLDALMGGEAGLADTSHSPAVTGPEPGSFENPIHYLWLK